ncbi:hypothetical protein ANN_09376 [Periplaneta americana]|uniref:Reverse transcriptase n=1 Tax=Periplaneta americana TaxID=6978 RepID=A0ABQ8TL84_PERAM|nr:hypothetical protein ANN_09376 [Periplaneta americana]
MEPIAGTSGVHPQKPKYESIEVQVEVQDEMEPIAGTSGVHPQKPKYESIEVQRSMMEVYRRKRAVFAYLVYKNYLKRTERRFWEHPLVAKRFLQAMVTGHGILKSYLQRFEIINDATCSCLQEAQTVDHVIYRCRKLQQQRDIFRHQIDHGWATHAPKVLKVLEREKGRRRQPQQLEVVCSFAAKVTVRSAAHAVVVVAGGRGAAAAAAAAVVVVVVVVVVVIVVVVVG